MANENERYVGKATKPQEKLPNIKQKASHIGCILKYKNLEDVLKDPDSNTSKFKALGIAIGSHYSITCRESNRENIEYANFDRKKIKTLFDRGWILPNNGTGTSYSIETLEKVKYLDLGKLEKYHTAGLNFWLPALFNLNKINIDDEKIQEFSKRKICIEEAERLDKSTIFPFDKVEELSKRGTLSNLEINQLIENPDCINRKNVKTLENSLGIEFSLYDLFHNDDLDRFQDITGYDPEDLKRFKDNNIEIDGHILKNFKGKVIKIFRTPLKIKKKIHKEHFQPFINNNITIPYSTISDIQKNGSIKGENIIYFIRKNDDKWQEIIEKIHQNPNDQSLEQELKQREEEISQIIEGKIDNKKSYKFKEFLKVFQEIKANLKE